jgi:hypothetical protein
LIKHYVARGLLAATMLIGLSACVSMPPQQAYNREAHATVKKIAVLETKPTQTGVFMLNNPGANFGLIGGLIAAADQASKEKRFHETQAAAGFDPLAYFKERLTTRMTDRGYTLVWPDSLVQKKNVARGAFGLRKEYAGVQDVDAMLDVNLQFIGYAAAGASDSTPYRPTLTVGARLVSPDGKQNFYTDYFAYNNVFNMQQAVTLNADEKYSYPDFDKLHAAGPQSIEGLKLAIDTVVDELARQL